MRLIGGLTALVIAGALLSGCTSTPGGDANAGGTASGGSATPTPTVTKAPRVKPNFMPAFSPTTAADNQRLFVIVMEQGLVAEGANAQSSGQAERLAAAGFDRGGIQWTDNSTAIGLISDSMFVAAEVGGECLVGQYGNSLPVLALSVVPALPAGGCLLGKGINHF